MYIPTLNLTKNSKFLLVLESGIRGWVMDASWMWYLRTERYLILEVFVKFY